MCDHLLKTKQKTIIAQQFRVSFTLTLSLTKVWPKTEADTIL